MFRSVWRWNSTSTEASKSIGLLPYKRKFFPATKLVPHKIRVLRGSCFLRKDTRGLQRILQRFTDVT